MAVKIPEFILAGMFEKGSLQRREESFSFVLKNSYAPATILGFSLEINGEAVAAEELSLQLEGGAVPVPAGQLGEEHPFALPVDRGLTIMVGRPLEGEGKLRISVLTREVGELSFSVKTREGAGKKQGPVKGMLSRGRQFFGKLAPPVKASVHVDSGKTLGTINPMIYGHFVEHLENCVYGGIWDKDGKNLNQDVVELVKEMAPPVIRYPGGNFASDYHWEDGVGPAEKRPKRYNRAWHVEDSNRVGTNEFLAFCRQTGAEPLLVVNDGSGTAEEAARWVAYCNEEADGPVGALRAEHGFPEAWKVRYWGLGNEVWGDWQIGHTDAEGYVERIRPFIRLMKEADPDIRLVAVGLDHLEGDPRRAEEWNRTVLEGIGKDIDYLSFHIYQPSEEGYRPAYDQEKLYRSMTAAPLSVEDAILRMADLVREVLPGEDAEAGSGCRPAIALDEWNAKYPPGAGARTMHQQRYTLRDSLYVAGMFHVFHRYSRVMGMANLALLVNALPAVIKDEGRPAALSPVGLPFLLYRKMKGEVLESRVESPRFDAPALGLNISEKKGVPFLDASLTADQERGRFTIALINRHPRRSMAVRLAGIPAESLQGSRLQGNHYLTEDVEIREVSCKAGDDGKAVIKLPPASVTILETRRGR
jgi:alpha-L-arabinofuranosidase